MGLGRVGGNGRGGKGKGNGGKGRGEGVVEGEVRKEDEREGVELRGEGGRK